MVVVKRKWDNSCKVFRMGPSCDTIRRWQFLPITRSEPLTAGLGNPRLKLSPGDSWDHSLMFCLQLAEPSIRQPLSQASYVSSLIQPREEALIIPAFQMRKQRPRGEVVNLKLTRCPLGTVCSTRLETEKSVRGDQSRLPLRSSEQLWADSVASVQSNGRGRAERGFREGPRLTGRPGNAASAL